MKTKSLLMLAVLAILATVGFTGCDELAVEDNPMQAYMTMRTGDVTLRVGETYLRKAVAAGTAVVVYSSSDATVATVDQQGKVTAINPGTATITAQTTGYNAEGKKIYLTEEKSYKVTVVPVNSLSIPALLTVAVGNSATIIPTIDPADYPIQWSSSDESIATVDETGKVTGVKASAVPVTITAKAGGKTATCAVAVGILDLSVVTEDATIPDGIVVTGTLAVSSPAKVSIAAGATVYLAGATINNTVECLGNATIVLNNETVNTISAATTAIKAGPAGTTLTLSGEGTLNATSSGINYACIGSQFQGAAGNIVIEGGIINATASHFAAAIGAGGSGSCQDITIQGGTVTAHATGNFGAGIGTGENFYGPTSCGNITITGGIVNAYGGAYGAGIGAGGSENDTNTITCGDITITGGTVNANGGGYGAGIGTGRRYNSSNPRPTCGNITISGGTITATKGVNAVWDIGPGIRSTYPGTYDGFVNGTISVTVTVKDKNGNNASIYAVAP